MCLSVTKCLPTGKDILNPKLHQICIIGSKITAIFWMDVLAQRVLSFSTSITFFYQNPPMHRCIANSAIIFYLNWTLLLIDFAFHLHLELRKRSKFNLRTYIPTFLPSYLPTKSKVTNFGITQVVNLQNCNFCLCF